MGLAVVQHTNCGMELFALPEVADAITKIFGTTDVVATSAIRDVRQSVSADVGRALKSVPAGISVSDRLYDVTTGQLEEIVAPAVAG